MSLKCLMNGLEVNYPCSPTCALFGDCCAAFEAQRKSRVVTNADHIRGMSDEELAALLDAFCETSECRTADGAVCPFFSDCASDTAECNWKVWLEQPYKEDNT